MSDFGDTIREAIAAIERAPGCDAAIHDVSPHQKRVMDFVVLEDRMPTYDESDAMIA